MDLRVQGQLSLRSEFQDILGYIERPYPKKTKKVLLQCVYGVYVQAHTCHSVCRSQRRTLE